MADFVWIDKRDGIDDVAAGDINTVAHEVERLEIDKQDKLESGTNIKTVNNESLLGSGNITISGGGETNVLEGVQVDGTDLTIDANKKVNIATQGTYDASTNPIATKSYADTKLRKLLGVWTPAGQYDGEVCIVENDGGFYSFTKWNEANQEWEPVCVQVASYTDYDNEDSGLSADTVQEAIDELASEKVDKETGKGLSSNDYINEDALIVERVKMYGSNIQANGELDYDTFGTGNTQVMVQQEQSSPTLTVGDIVIPYEYNSKPVTVIRQDAFSGNTYITSIIIPSSVTKINKTAFYGCTNLKAVYVPDSIVSDNIGENVFQNCPNLTVYCNSGSYAESYCQTNNINYKIRTDYYNKQDTTSIVTQSAPSTIALADNTTYYLTNVSSLTLTSPQDTHWECLIQLETASSGAITITFPNGTTFIGAVPTTFGNSETWEISIRDGIAVCGKAVSAS